MMLTHTHTHTHIHTYTHIYVYSHLKLSLMSPKNDKIMIILAKKKKCNYCELTPQSNLKQRT